MRYVARQAALSLNRRMFVNEGTGCFRVALHANCIAGHTAMQALVFKRAMRIMTITAAYQAFVDSVMEGLRKSWLDIAMAGIAKLWLLNFEKAGFAVKFVNAMTTCAAYPCFAMCSPLEIRMSCGVALQALFICRLRCCLAELKDLCGVTARLHMILAWSVTAFACHSFAAV